jgi:hypothetical protein
MFARALQIAAARLLKAMDSLAESSHEMWLASRWREALDIVYEGLSLPGFGRAAP